ncbi:hypothetical protein EJM73_08325 [Clostridium botulinum]|uniref:hypothetical protein n=1 Tax=Clostridium botulinum TaxID=1491 RepID=UPI00137616A9|nr:hypothetical protein [Clostridium botulinum]NCI19905.1 hypothetical protein [Clostridium botulinum]NCI35667.1 hypothetical protein [Clostridium botulinum]NCI71800.1 hypothetical protein [Clostridium botulinum]NDI38716.1 hypothetical protein [Clostridium botulinum]HCL4455055.1 hypothetical protein [Clostridium botulinum]
MSEIVQYKGKLIKLEKLNNETLEQQSERFCKENNLYELPDFYDTWEEYLTGELYKRYYINNNNLYIIKSEQVDPECDIFNASMNDNGEIEFEIKYYNGGCGFDEALDEAISNLKKVIKLK